MQKVQDALASIVSAIGKERGLTLILRKDQTLFALPAYEITNKAVNWLDKQLAKIGSPNAPAKKKQQVTGRMIAPAHPGWPGSALGMTPCHLTHLSSSETLFLRCTFERSNHAGVGRFEGRRLGVAIRNQTV